MNECPDCHAILSARAKKCDACGLSVEQEFARTMRKPPNDDDDRIPTRLKEIKNQKQFTDASTETGRFVAGNVLASRYRIVRLLGRGGMGEVYLAIDTKLDRKVALKILPTEFAENSDRMSRFVREAKSASALNHPNIITIYEIGEADGTHFIAAEFIDGKTLNEYLKSNPLDFKSSLEIAIQIASALDEAHSAGIVHRDIKPDNVMIRPNGLAKILDFGIAKLSAAPTTDGEAATAVGAQTQAGVIIGTPNYMSPEQARGLGVDHQTDIFSFGAVFYEMLSGKRAFAGETVSDVIAAVLTREPRRLSEIPAELEEIVNKTLHKEKRKRYQTAKDLLRDLKEVKQELEIQSRLERASSPNSEEPQTQILNAPTTAEENLQTAIPNLKSVAVLPFANMSADAENEYFCDGLAEELLNALAKIDELKVAARTSAFSFKGKNAEASQIGKMLNVKTVLEGSVRRAGNRLRITVQLINAADGYHLWSERYDREMRDIFDVQDEITLAVVDALKLKLFSEEKTAALKRGTENTEAYEFYLKGRYCWNKRTGDNLKKAVEMFQRAVEKDPNYALAFVGLADSYLIIGSYTGIPASEVLPQAKAAAERALQIDDQSAEARASMAHTYWRLLEWERAEAEFQHAISLNPNYATAHQFYSEYLRALRRFDEELREIKKAQEIEPLSHIIGSFAGEAFQNLGDTNAAISEWKRVIELEPNFSLTHFFLGNAYVAERRCEEAIAEAQKAVDLSDRGNLPLGGLGYVYAMSGKRAEALTVVKELEEKHARREATGFDLAHVYAGLKETDEAINWLEKDFETGNTSLLIYVAMNSLYRQLGGDPRYQNLLRRMGFPAEIIPQCKIISEASEARTAMLSPAATDGEETLANTSKNVEQALPAKPKTKPKWWMFSLLGLILLASGFFGYRYFTPTSKQIESIAVLPFENASGNADVEYLSDGMTETLISSLSQLPNLNVKARSSVFRYKGKSLTPPEIGKELNVQALLNGVVIQRGQNLILNVELVDAQTENVLWSQNYNRKQTDLISLQTEIARDVSQKLKTKLSGADEQKLAKNYTENTEAYKLYLQGRFYWNKRTPNDFRKAIEYFRQAITVDPNYALAFAGLADAYGLLSDFGGAPPREVMPKAKEAALKALSLDNNLAEARTALALVLSDYDYDFAGAERELKRAVELNPNYETAHQWYGMQLSYQGRQEESFAAFRRALEIDPLSLPINWSYGISLLHARKYDEAIAQLKKTVELDKNFAGAHYSLSTAYQLKGNYAESVEEYAKVAELFGSPENASLIRESFARGGWQGFLRALAENQQADLSRYTLATTYAQLGEKDKAFAELNKAYENREYGLVLFKVDPRLDPLRSDPRFEELLRKVGFPP